MYVPILCVCPRIWSAQLDQSEFLLFITFLLFYVSAKMLRGMLVMLSLISIGFIYNSLQLW